MADMEPISDRRAVSSPENGRKGGRPPVRQKYAPVINATHKALAEILRDNVPDALRELVCGVQVAEETEDGRVVYSRPPDLKAIEMVMNRILGPLERDDPTRANAIATVVNIIRNVPDLNA